MHFVQHTLWKYSLFANLILENPHHTKKNIQILKPFKNILTDDCSFNLFSNLCHSLNKASKIQFDSSIKPKI